MSNTAILDRTDRSRSRPPPARRDGPGPDRRPRPPRRAGLSGSAQPPAGHRAPRLRPLRRPRRGQGRRGRRLARRARRRTAAHASPSSRRTPRPTRRSPSRRSARAVATSTSCASRCTSPRRSPAPSRRTCRRRTAPPGGVVVDISRKRVLIDGESAAFTFKEFELLQYLVLREGRTIERTELVVVALAGHDRRRGSRRAHHRRARPAPARQARPLRGHRPHGARHRLPVRPPRRRRHPLRPRHAFARPLLTVARLGRPQHAGSARTLERRVVRVVPGAAARMSAPPA